LTGKDAHLELQIYYAKERKKDLEKIISIRK